MLVNKTDKKYSEICLLYNAIFYGLDISTNEIPTLIGINYLDTENKIFKNEHWEKLLICYTDSASLDFKQFEALKKSCSYLNEHSIYLLHVEVDSPVQMPDIHEYKFDFFEYSADDIVSYNDNVIFSSSGKWGILVAHEDFAVISGEKKFIQNFKDNYPEWENGLSHFIEMWEEDSKGGKLDIKWVSPFLRNLL